MARSETRLAVPFSPDISGPNNPHDWGDVARDGFAAIFRAAEETMSPVPGFSKK
jgi:hypothetical protein